MKQLLLFTAFLVCALCNAQNTFSKDENKIYKLEDQLGTITSRIIRAKSEATLDSIKLYLSEIDTIGTGNFFKKRFELFSDEINFRKRLINPHYDDNIIEKEMKIYNDKYGTVIGRKIYFIDLEPGMTFEMMNDAMNKSYISQYSHTTSKDTKGKWDIYTYKTTEKFYIITLLNWKIIDVSETSL